MSDMPIEQKIDFGFIFFDTMDRQEDSKAMFSIVLKELKDKFKVDYKELEDIIHHGDFNYIIQNRLCYVFIRNNENYIQSIFNLSIFYNRYKIFRYMYENYITRVNLTDVLKQTIGNNKTNMFYDLIGKGEFDVYDVFDFAIYKKRYDIAEFIFKNYKMDLKLLQDEFNRACSCEDIIKVKFFIEVCKIDPTIDNCSCLNQSFSSILDNVELLTYLIKAGCSKEMALRYSRNLEQMKMIYEI